MKSKLLLLTMFVAGSANASYLESCDLKVNVKSLSKILVLGGTVSTEGTAKSDKKGIPVAAVVEILSAEDQGSHLPDACKDKVGKTLILNLEKTDPTSVKEGDTFIVSYFYVNSRSPGGISEFTRVTRKTE